MMAGAGFKGGAGVSISLACPSFRALMMQRKMR